MTYLAELVPLMAKTSAASQPLQVAPHFYQSKDFCVNGMSGTFSIGVVVVAAGGGVVAAGGGVGE